MAGSGVFTSFSQKQDGSVTCVIDYIIESQQKYMCIVCPAGTEATDFPDECLLEACFVFDQEHMWVERLVEKRWYSLDSRSTGPMQISKPGRDLNLGRIFVFRRPRPVPIESELLTDEPDQPRKTEKKKKVTALRRAVVAKPKRQQDPESLFEK